jgi:tetratricopeptide (TPR) repeat protein
MTAIGILKKPSLFSNNELGKLLAGKRNFSESEKMLEKALEIEPFSPLYNASLCKTYYFDKKTEEALKYCKFAMQLEPNFWVARKQLFWIYVSKKMNKEVAEMVLGNYSEDAKAKLPFAKSMEKIIGDTHFPRQKPFQAITQIH